MNTLARLIFAGAVVASVTPISVTASPADVATESMSAPTPGGCETPVSQRTNEVGCYLTATENLGEVPQGPLFWHLYNYPNRAAADAAKGSWGTVVESFGRVWLYTIADAAWRPSGGERIAVIGPLATIAGKRYTARYMEVVFTPGMVGGASRTSTSRSRGMVCVDGGAMPGDARRHYSLARLRKWYRRRRSADVHPERRD